MRGHGNGWVRGIDVSDLHVLVATDGSDTAVSAARHGLELLGPPARLTVLTVIAEVASPEVSGFAGPTVSPTEQEETLRQERVEADAAIDATLTAMGVDHAERLVIEGEPGTAVCEAAGDVGSDVVVVGSHGRGGIGRALMGSVSDHVVRNAPCPVLVVREGVAAA
jgi:nucleotide-binding universal stress UspA family protein